MSVLVVGAGISGALCARSLHRAGVAVTVIDKGRGVGGRMATRRIGDAVFDHGAQFFTQRTPAFAAVVDELAAAGSVVPWFEGLLAFGGEVTPDGEVRHRGHPSMTAPVKELTRGLDVRTGTHATAAHPAARGWEVPVDGGDPLEAEVLVLTAPVPQSVALLDAGGARLPRADRAVLDRIAYDPCLAVLATLVAPTTLPEPGALRPAEEPVAWVGDNQRKGISPVPCVTIHAGPHTSRDLWSEPDEIVVRHLLGAVEPLGVGPATAATVMRWRYATPIAPHPAPCLATRTPRPLVLAGDAFDGPRVEGAARSGLSAAEAAIDLLRGR